jgi:plasmid replication initiation protein
VKSSLEDGSITKQDVLELEKILGSDIGQLVTMIEKGKKMDKNLLGSEFNEMVDIFRQLAQIKKK